MTTRTIPLFPTLGPRPSYAEVAKYQQAQADLNSLDNLVAEVRQDMADFQGLDGTRHDQHPEEGCVVVDRANLQIGRRVMTATSMLLGAASAETALVGLGGLAMGGGVEKGVAAVSWMASSVLAALQTFPVLAVGTALLGWGLGFAHRPLARETGELESKNGQVVRFWHKSSENLKGTAYSKGAEVETFQNELGRAEIHRSEGWANIENLDPPVLPTSLEPAQWRFANPTEMPIEAESGPWLSDRKEHQGTSEARRQAEAGQQDFRPQEPGNVIVCSHQSQGELRLDAEGKPVFYGEKNPSSSHGFVLNGPLETYYEKGAEVVVDRTNGTLTYYQIRH